MPDSTGNGKATFAVKPGPVKPPAAPPKAAGGAPAARGAPMPPVDQLKNRPLGRVLIKMGRITREQVHQALAAQQKQKANKINTPLGQVFVDLKMITPKDLNFALAAQRGFEVVDLENRQIPPEDRLCGRWGLRLRILRRPKDSEVACRAVQVFSRGQRDGFGVSGDFRCSRYFGTPAADRHDLQARGESQCDRQATYRNRVSRGDLHDAPDFTVRFQEVATTQPVHYHGG